MDGAYSLSDVAVDAHLHLFATEEEGLLAQGGSQQAGYLGLPSELQEILDRGRVDRAVIASALVVDIWRRLLNLDEEQLVERSIAQNEWAASVCASDPRLFLAVGADATLDLSAHLEDMLSRPFVRAIKIHPALNQTLPSHEGFRPAFVAGVPVISHGGGNAEGLYDSAVEWCAPREFADVLREHRHTTFVVAHFAHPWHRELIDLAASHANLMTDLSFVVAMGARGSRAAGRRTRLRRRARDARERLPLFRPGEVAGRTGSLRAERVRARGRLPDERRARVPSLGGTARKEVTWQRQRTPAR
jgi:predicted TIM-barrel fold metal-dependent hydrolase